MQLCMKYNKYILQVFNLFSFSSLMLKRQYHIFLYSLNPGRNELFSLHLCLFLGLCYLMVGVLSFTCHICIPLKREGLWLWIKQEEKDREQWLPCSQTLGRKPALSHCTLTWTEILVFTLAPNKAECTGSNVFHLSNYGEICPQIISSSSSDP